jgi:hypothetical protein
MARDTSAAGAPTKITSALVLIESALVLALAIYMVALGFTHDKEWAPYLGVIAFAFIGSAGLFALSWGIKNERRWANAPTLLANLIALGVAKYQFEAGLYWLAIPILVFALLIILSILNSCSRSFHLHFLIQKFYMSYFPWLDSNI